MLKKEFPAPNKITEIIKLIESDLLSVLDLPNCNLAKEDAEKIANALKGNNNIQTLKLSGNEFGDEGLKHLCEALKSNKNIVSLDISNNGLTDKSAVYLSDMLQEQGSNSIKHLDVSSNQIEEAGLSKLLGVPYKYRAWALKSLYVDHNAVCDPISDVGSQIIDWFLKHDLSVEVLSFSNVNAIEMSEVAVKRIIEALECNYTVIQFTGVNHPSIQVFCMRNKKIIKACDEISDYLQKKMNFDQRIIGNYIKNLEDSGFNPDHLKINAFQYVTKVYKRLIEINESLKNKLLSQQFKNIAPSNTYQNVVGYIYDKFNSMLNLNSPSEERVIQKLQTIGGLVEANKLQEIRQVIEMAKTCARTKGSWSWEPSVKKALEKAIVDNKVDIITIFIEGGADITRGLVELAFEHNFSHIVKLLIKYEAEHCHNPEVAFQWCDKLIRGAMQKRDMDLVNFLLESGANISSELFQDTIKSKQTFLNHVIINEPPELFNALIYHLENWCGLVKTNENDKNSDEEIVYNGRRLLKNRVGLVLHKNNLFFGDGHIKTLRKIEVTDHNHVYVEQLKERCTTTYLLANHDSRKLITHLTGYSDKGLGLAISSSIFFAYEKYMKEFKFLESEIEGADNIRKWIISKSYRSPEEKNQALNEFNEKLNSYSERCNDNKSAYEKIVKTLMDYASGCEFAEDFLDNLRDIDISGINFIGTSIEGKPISRSLLNANNLIGAEHALTTLDDLEKLEDFPRREFLKNRIGQCIDIQGRSVKEGEVNLVPLGLAVKAGDLETVKSRLMAGINPNLDYGREGKKQIPIEIAAQEGLINIAQLLMEHPDFDSGSIKNAIEIAKKYGKNNWINMVRRMTGINEKDSEGNTPLHYAIINLDVQEVMDLIKHGADVNIKGKDYPLNLAVDQILRYYGYSRDEDLLEDAKKVGIILATLLGSGANPNVTSHTPLHFAVGIDALNVLLPVCNKYPCINSDQKRSPWYSGIVSCSYKSPQFIEILQLLKLQGADFRSEKSGAGDMLWGLCHNFPSIGDFSEQRKNYVNNEITEKYDKLTRALMIGVNPNLRITRYGNTVLHHILNYSNLDLETYKSFIDLFLKYGFDINQVNDDKSTVLDLAIVKKRWAVAKYLLKLGAEPSVVEITQEISKRISEENLPYAHDILLENYHKKYKIGESDVRNKNFMFFPPKSSAKNVTSTNQRKDFTFQ